MSVLVPAPAMCSSKLLLDVSNGLLAVVFLVPFVVGASDVGGGGVVPEESVGAIGRGVLLLGALLGAVLTRIFRGPSWGATWYRSKKRFQMSWDELLDHGDEPFDLSFPPVCDVCHSLTLKAAAVHDCDDQDNMLSYCLVDSDIARDTDAGHALLAEYISSEAVSHLNDAMQHFQSVLDQCPVGHPDHAAALTNLSYAHLGGYIQNHLQDIDTTTSLFRESLALRLQGHPDHTSSLLNLITALNWHYSKESTAIYIHKSAQLCCKLLPLCPQCTYFYSISVDGAASTFDETFLSSVLAIILRRKALTLCPPGHPHCDTRLNNLAYALKTRYDESYVSEDLNEAIDRYRESHLLMWLDNPERHVTLCSLSGALCSRFTHTRKNGDVQEAIQLCQEALASLPSLHPDRYFSYRGLKDAYLSRYQIHHDPADLSLAIALLRHKNGPLQRSSIVMDLHWRPTQHFSSFWMLIWQHDHAASCAIRSGNLRYAVELVEQGRGQQWSLASRLKTPVEDLEAAADWAATEYRRLVRQWEAVVAEIQDLRAFSRFLLPPSYEDLQAAARYGPVIILITSQYSCSAIIVLTSGDPLNVPLPSLSLTELNNLKDRFARAIQHASVMGPKVPRNDLIVLLWTVWDEIMLPIVKVLKNVFKLNHHSRIWLCPTAAFTFIPLHAAHPFQTKADGSKESCLEDLYICSYTPTLSALVRSRQMMKKRVTPSFATVGQGQPGAGKGKALLAVDSELELIYKLVPATAKRENTWVHLACHGKQDPAQPYDSHFVMRDEHLTLLNIMEKDIPHAEFAFLSACHTAVSNEKMPDEVIHLAAGLQFSGFKSIIGTLWEVNNAVTKHVVEAFYKYMFMDLKDGNSVVMDCSRAAWALNCAMHACHIPDSGPII
ncbi:CHAT domain-containing protein [Suillus cothurnatus]|nr:CHAT domain-containing protein [Suillus cothurnatus]